jgi:SPX domain protein involved in polyphosphate accumulation
MHENVFQRVEKKYMLDSVTYRTLMLRIGDRLISDAYGRYTVSNLYFDTPDWLLARRSIEQPPFKEKLRLRGYGIPAPGDRVFLELKRKVDGVVYKRRESMTLSQAEQYLKTGRHFAAGRYERARLLHAAVPPRAGVYLAYDRRAFTGKEDPALRITFDTGIRSRTDKLRLGAGDWGTPLSRTATA